MKNIYYAAILALISAVEPCVASEEKPKNKLPKIEIQTLPYDQEDFHKYKKMVTTTPTSLQDLSKAYKEKYNLTDDVKIKFYQAKKLIDKIESLQFNPINNTAYIDARSFKEWKIAPTEKINNEPIKPFTIELEEDEPIKWVKDKITEVIHNTYPNLHTKSLTILINKNKEILADDDTMPSHTAAFNLNDYAVHIFEPASASDPLITENKTGLPSRVKAQQPTPIGKPAPEKPTSWRQRLASWLSWFKRGK